VESLLALKEESENLKNVVRELLAKMPADPFKEDTKAEPNRASKIESSLSNGAEAAKIEEEDKVTPLREEINRLKKALEEEQRISALLAAEVQTLPDYIQLYHQERKQLR
jgi:GTP cyclohydrolase I